MMSALPICFYPLRKIILDDDKDFTQSVLLKLHGKNFTSYHSPKAALHDLLEKYKPTLTKSDLALLDAVVDNPATQHAIQIQTEKLISMLGNPHQNDISVLLVDYHMPEMFGLEFLQEIKHLPMKKVLVTGESDYKIGIDAFNNGLVDAYLRKDDSDFANKIQNIVSELEWKYFSDLSNLILDIPDFSYLKDARFIKTFKQFMQDNNITAFCLTDVEGDFLVEDKDLKQKYFLVRTKKQLDELARVAVEDGGSDKVVDDLQQARVIPFFGGKQYWEIPAGEWETFIYPAHSIIDRGDLFFAVVNIKVIVPQY